MKWEFVSVISYSPLNRSDDGRWTNDGQDCFFVRRLPPFVQGGEYFVTLTEFNNLFIAA